MHKEKNNQKLQIFKALYLKINKHYCIAVIQIHKRDSVVQIRMHLLTSDFGLSTRGERHNS